MATARPGTESAARTNTVRNRKQMKARNKAAEAAKKRQATAKKKHKAKMAWYDKWYKKKLAAINASGKTAAQKRKSRNQIKSKYNRWRNAEIRSFRRITSSNYSPPSLTPRTNADIFDHYDIQRLFSADLSTGGINDVIAGQAAGRPSYTDDEYASSLDEEYTPVIPTLSLGVASLAGLVQWTEVYDDSGNRTYTAVITVPNSDQFFQIKTRVSG